MSATPEFRDIDGNILQAGDTVVAVETWDDMDGRLVKGVVLGITNDCVIVYESDKKQDCYVTSSQRILYLYT